MAKEQFFDQVDLFLGRLPKDIRDRVPPKCRNCPTMLWIARAAMEDDKEIGRLKEIPIRELHALGEKEGTPSKSGFVYTGIQINKSRIERATAARDSTQRGLNMLVERADACPTGAIVGNLKLIDPVAAALSKVLGPYMGLGPRDHSCPNPAFQELQGSPEAADALRYGTWIGAEAEIEA